MQSVIVIAEAGVNHNGSVQTAAELIRAAGQTGADAVKFQTYSADRLTTNYARKAKYQVADGPPQESQYEMLKRLQLSDDDFVTLETIARHTGIEFMSSPFDTDSARLLQRIGMRFWKVPSGEITNRPLLEILADIAQNVILSTGMSNLGEVEQALELLTTRGLTIEQVTLLHCTSAYPTSPTDVNLRAMLTLKSAFGTSVGYSDHTIGSAIPLAAVALGASVVEKHFTLSRAADGPDQTASMEPQEFREMVEGIRAVSHALGTGRKKPTKAEIENRQYVRKSLVASRNISRGELLDESNMESKRPGTGLSPMLLHTISGRPAPRDFLKDEQIEL